MALTTDLIAAIKAGFYIGATGNSVTYKAMFTELLTMAQTTGFNQTIMLLTRKLDFITRRQDELVKQIDLLNQSMNNAELSQKYSLMISFLQVNAETDPSSIPVFNTASMMLSGQFTNFKDLYQELTTVTYKQALFESVLLNLTQNQSKIATLITDVAAI